MLNANGVRSTRLITTWRDGGGPTADAGGRAWDWNGRKMGNQDVVKENEIEKYRIPLQWPLGLRRVRSVSVPLACYTAYYRKKSPPEAHLVRPTTP